MSLVLGVVGSDIGEVANATIPFKRLDLRGHPGHGTPEKISYIIAFLTSHEQAEKAKKARFGYESIPNQPQCRRHRYRRG